MANPEHLEILKQGVEGWNQWRRKKPTISPDLSDAILDGLIFIESGVNERGAFQRSYRLDRVDFSGASLIGANFGGIELYEADKACAAGLRQRI